MSIILNVSLWPVAGREEALIAYEDAVLALVPVHGGVVLQRARKVGADDGAYEVQTIELPDEAALDSFMADPARLALSAQRDASVARTEILRVEIV